MTGAERKARNEITFRYANEELKRKAAALLGADDGSPVPFLCECPLRECTQVVLLTLGEYEQVRADPRRGLAVIGHHDPEIERIVEVTDRFVVTEKLGAAGEIVETEGPRA